MNELLVALALLLVFEGILPFLSPRIFKRILKQMLQEEDRSLRLVGLTSMLAGLGLLYLVN